MITAHTALTLPRMPRARGTFTFRRDAANPKVARLALILLELGILRANDAPDLDHVTESVLVERALARWTSEAAGDLLVLHDVYTVINPDAAEQCLSIFEYTGWDAPEITPDDAVVLAQCPWDDGEHWVLGPRCTELEQRVPGLAQTAIEILDRALWASAQGLTPRHARYMADEYLYCWEDTHRDDDDRGLSKEAFDAAIPRWVHAPKPKVRGTKLKALAEREPVAAAILDLIAALGDKNAAETGAGGFEHSVFSVVLRWSTTDPIPQVHHDLVYQTQQGGESTSDYSFWFMPLTRQAVQQALDAYRRRLRILGCTDRLIALIAENEDSLRDAQPARVMVRV